MEFVYDVVLTTTRTSAAIGRTVHAALGADGRPCRLPARVREAFA
jgi:acyl-CoA thioesterase FadM